MANALLNYAQQYVKNGWSVLPLKPSSKEPRIQWKEYSTKKPSLETLASWFATSDCNLGIVTGAISSLVVVDVDSLEGLDYAKKHGLTSSVYVVTGKGKHFYFRHPGKEVSNAVRVFPGIDIRGDNGYVLAPPSTHPSGRRYLWNSAQFLSSRLPRFPVEVLHEQPVLAVRSDSWIAEALSKISEGNRNDTFASIVGKLHRNKWSAADIYQLLLPHCERVAFPSAELQAIVDSISRYRDEEGQHNSIPELQREPLRVYSFGRSMDEYRQRKHDNQQGTGYYTGYRKIDDLTKGLRRGEVFVVAARPGIGKTNWLIGASKHLCESGKSVLYFSTEMRFDSIWDRYSALVGGVENCRTHKFLVCDEFVSDLKRIKDVVSEIRPDALVFDHINFVGEDHVEISALMKGLKRIAKEADIPALVAAQLNRQADWVDPKTQSRVIPRLSMIKGSGAIEEVAAQAILLSEISSGPDQNDLVGNLDKNRYGERDCISFALRKSPYQMVEVE